MRKKKLPIVKWLLSVAVVAVLAGGYWLSLERPAPLHEIDKPVVLKIKPLQ